MPEWKLDDVVRVSEELSSARSPEQVYATVTSAVREVLHADGTTFVLREENLCHYVEEDAIEPLWRGKRFEADACVSGWAMKSGQVAVVSDIEADERVPADIYRPTFVRSLIMAPIRPSDPIGAIGAYWSQPRQPDDREVRFLKLIAAVSGLSLENAHLVDRLQSSTAELRAIFDHTLQAMLVFDKQLRALDVNEVAQTHARRLFGRELDRGADVRPFFALVGDVKNFETSAADAFAGNTLTHVSEIKLKERSAWFEVCYAPILSSSGTVDAVILSALDITEIREAQLQLARAQRNDAIGRLTQGIAHDFNNALTPIMFSASTLRSRSRSAQGFERDIDTIEEASRYAAALTRQLLAFGNHQQIDITAVDVNGEIDKMRRLMRGSLSDSIEIEMRLDDELPPIAGDATQIAQVVLNLLINAMDALRESGGTITVISERIGPESIAFRVRDNGPGIEPAVMQHIFEPLFTTKGAGGTGLGLATCMNIVRHHGGTIDVAAAPGGGAEFTATLPIGQPPPREDVPAAGRVRPQGAGSILVVDDDARVRKAIHGALAEAGYRTYSASGAAEAEALARDLNQAGGIALIVVDVLLRGSDGPSLVRLLRRLVPDLRVLYVSGHAGDGGVPPEALPSDVHFLPKPFSSDELLESVRQALLGT